MIPFEAAPISPILTSIALVLSVSAALVVIVITSQMIVHRENNTKLSQVFMVKCIGYVVNTVMILIARILTLDEVNFLMPDGQVSSVVTTFVLISGAGLTVGGPTSYHYAVLLTGQAHRKIHQIGLYVAYSVAAIGLVLFLFFPQALVELFIVSSARDIAFLATPFGYAFIPLFPAFTFASLVLYAKHSVKNIRYLVLSEVFVLMSLAVPASARFLHTTPLLTALVFLSMVSLAWFYVKSPDLNVQRRIVLARETALRSAEKNLQSLKLANEQNARLAMQHQQARLRAEIMFNVSMAANQAQDLDGLLNTILNTYFVNTDTKWVILQLANAETRTIHNSMFLGPEGLLLTKDYDEFASGLAGQAFVNQDSILASSGDGDELEPPVFKEIRQRLGIGSTMSAPLVRRGKSLGAITALQGIDKPPYDQDDIDLLSAVANQMANTIATYMAGAELRQSEAQFRTLIQHAPDGIMLLDVDQRSFIDVNKKLCDMIGVSREVLLKIDPITLALTGLTDKYKPRIARAIHTALTQGYYTKEFSFKRSDGSELPLEVQMLRLPHKQRNLIRVSAIDLSHRKQAETAMVQSQKQESLSVMAGGIAHDFNNILLAVTGQAQIIQRRLDEDSKIQKNVAKIQKAAGRASELTRQMMAYAGRGQTTDRTVFNINALIEENTELFSTTISESVRFEKSLAADVSPILAEVSQVEQIVLNMIINANEAIGEKSGVISISTQEITLTETALEPWQALSPDIKPGQFVRLMFIDTGCGMDADTKARIFDPFFTTKHSGHGLGLAAVLGIIRSHGGSIQVESNVGQGTKFEILFPAEDLAKPSTDGFLETDETQLIGRTVLLVDDDETILETLAETLQSYGLHIYTATSGLNGIAVYEEHQEEIDLVLSDVAMPGISGVEAMRRLLAITPNLPVVLSSGYNRVDAEKVAQEIENVFFLQKPYRIDQLLAVVVDMLPARKTLSVTSPLD